MLEREPPLGHWHPRILLIRGVIGVALLAGATGWIASGSSSTADFAMGVLALLTYCVAGHVITPRPNYNDVGWLGGLVNNPFRLSDNLNRWLIFARVVLAPGRFMTSSIRDLVRLARGERVMVLPPRNDER